MRSHAFSLLELLLVVAILCLLAALLFPVFARAKENARRSSCSSNLRQIGLAFNQYAQDFDGWTPGSESGWVSWPTLIFPYVKGEEVFVCSSGTRTFAAADYLTPRTNYRDTSSNDGSFVPLRRVNRGLSYALNAIQTGRSIAGSNGWASVGFTGTPLAPGANGPKSGFIGVGATATIGLLEVQVEDPAGTIRVLDAMATANNGTSLRSISAEERTDGFALATPSKTSNRHSNGFNALWGDGHVKWRRYGSTTPDQWSIESDNADGSPKR